MAMLRFGCRSHEAGVEGVLAYSWFTRWPFDDFVDDELVKWEKTCSWFSFDGDVAVWMPVLMIGSWRCFGLWLRQDWFMGSLFCDFGENALVTLVLSRCWRGRSSLIAVLMMRELMACWPIVDLRDDCLVILSMIYWWRCWRLVRDVVLMAMLRLGCLLWWFGSWGWFG